MPTPCSCVEHSTSGPRLARGFLQVPNFRSAPSPPQQYRPVQEFRRNETGRSSAGYAQPQTGSCKTKSSQLEPVRCAGYAHARSWILAPTQYLARKQCRCVAQLCHGCIRSEPTKALVSPEMRGTQRAVLAWVEQQAGRQEPSARYGSSVSTRNLKLMAWRR